MVKLDTGRDYYADLDLPRDCSIDDVKKQFRKLALKYHPDRNPGKELECQPLFQAIQSAHEVLGDPEQRRKYDAAQKLGGPSETFRSAAAANRTSNPYKAHSDYPPPPRRTGPAAANAGAERYTSGNFPPPPKKNPTSSGQDAQARATAWQKMQSKPQTANTQRTDGFPSGRDRSEQSRTWDGTRASNQTDGRSDTSNRPPPPPRKTGFNPSAPLGDEAPARGYYDRAHRSQMRDGFQPQQTPARGPAPTARKAEAFPYEKVHSESPFVEAERIRTPYAAYTDEKTYFSTDDLRRSASTRNASKLPESTQKSDQASHRHSNRARSTSLPRKTSRTVDEERDNGTGSEHRPSVIYSSESTSSDSSDGDLEVKGSVKVKERPKKQPSAAWTKRHGDATFTNTRSPEDSRTGTPDETSVNNEPRSTRPAIFTFPAQGDTFTSTPTPLRSHSSGSINTNFHSGNGPIPFVGSRPTTPAEPARTSSQPVERATRGQTPSYVDPAPTTSDVRTPDVPVPPLYTAAGNSAAIPGAGTFSAARWSNENWSTRWSPQFSPSQPGISPTRQAANSRRARGAGLPANSSGTPRDIGTSQPASVEEEESGDPKTFTGSESSYRGVGDAMEIDSTPPGKAFSSSSMNEESTSRKHSLHYHHQGKSGFAEASRPETYDSPVDKSHRPSFPINIPPPPAGPPPAATSPRSNNLKMDDLRHTLPFQSGLSGTGLSDLNDIANTLPFQSQASNALPIRPLSNPMSPALPNPPKPPLPPQKLTQASWRYYMLQMTSYISSWNVFNGFIIEQLRSRSVEQTNMEKGRVGGMVDGWLGALGETGQLGGWDTYVRTIKEDQRIRTHWQVACEKHATAIETHGKLRDQVLRSGGLQ